MTDYRPSRAYLALLAGLAVLGLVAGILIAAAGPAYGQSCPPTTTTTESPHQARERAFQREVRESWAEALRQQDRTQWYLQGGRAGPPPDFQIETYDDGWEE